MDITPPASDKGTQRLKLENEDRTVKPTTAVAAYPRIESSEEEHTHQEPVSLERRKHQRRTSDRRQEHTQTPFDTRSGQDRRGKQRRKADSETQADEDESRLTTARGIDELV